MNGWKIACISDFCTTGTGSTPSRSNMERYYEGGTIPWVKSGELRESVINDTEEHVTEEALNETHLKLIPSGALLLAMYGATVGRLGILGASATTNQAVCHIIPDPKIAQVRYLFHLLRAQVPNIVARGVGGAQPNISQGIVKDLRIPLPALEEQKRIADILDRAEALRAKRRAVLAQLDELVQSIFIEMFGDLEINPKGWVVKSFDHFAKIDTKMIKDFGEHENKPHIGIENIEKDTGNLINYKEVGAQNLTSGKYLFTKDHIIYSKIRPNLNKVALPDFDGLCSADAYPLLVNNNHTNRYFFAYILRSKYFLNNILKLSDRTNIPKVNKDQLRSFECICPPIELQNQFARCVEAINKLKTKYKVSLAELDELFASFQYRAFRGKL